jgi:neutral ceramidase
MVTRFTCHNRSIFLGLGLVMVLLPVLVGSLAAAGFRAGVAQARITPPLPFWLSGYAARDKPASIVRTDLWAKALALADDQGTRIVIVTVDIIGVTRELTETVAEELQRLENLPRAHLMINASHTHAGPALLPNLSVMFDLESEDQERALAYGRELTRTLARIARDALNDLAPVRLDFGQGTTDFAMNRREFRPEGVRLGRNPDGPVDHDVPVLRVSTPDGGLRAILFGYACHCTTLGGDFYEVDGDFAGAAQRFIESQHPGVTALFLALCGGDQNPDPRGSVDHVEQHGRSLADAVQTVLEGSLRPLHPPLRAAYRVVPLEFAPHQRQTFEEEAQGSHRFRQRRARLMLEAYDRGAPVRDVEYPIQVFRFGNELTLIGLGGEVVVDYALRFKREFGRDRTVVAGYCNDVMCYIPSERMLAEGGYEVVDSMIYYGKPGPFAESVEETIVDAVRQMVQ